MDNFGHLIIPPLRGTWDCVALHYQRNVNIVKLQLLNQAVKIVQQDGSLHQGKVHLANQISSQLQGDEASDCD